MTNFSMADICRQTGLKRHWITYQIQTGNLPEPQRLGGNRRCFTEEQLDHIRSFFEQRRLQKLARQRALRRGGNHE